MNFRFSWLTPAHWLLVFIAGHMVLWTALPLLCMPGLPLDFTEVATWSDHLAWGYERHPPLASWLTHVALSLSHGHIWGYYLLAQLNMGLTFWLVWLLAKQYLTPESALAAVLLLAGVYPFTLPGYEFNPNFLQMPLWALAGLSLNRAAVTGRWHWWLLLGGAIGLALLAKYWSALLAIIIFGLVIYLKLWRSPKPFVAAIVAMFILLPHALWLLNNGFPPLDYVNARATDAINHLVAHVGNPLNFLINQLLYILSVLVLLLGWKQRLHLHKPLQPFAVVPIAITFVSLAIVLIAAVLSGDTLRAMYGTPLWIYTGLILMLYCQPAQPVALRCLGLSVVGLYVVFALIFALSLQFGVNKRAHFDGARLAAIVSNAWQQRYPDTPLPYVIGDLWLAGNVNYFSADRPIVFANQNPRSAPWVDMAAFACHGGMAVWDVKLGSDFTLPPEAIELPPQEITTISPAAKLNYTRSFALAIYPPKPERCR